MFGRKNKIVTEQGTARRQVNRSGGGSPAFSYYNNSGRTTEVSRDRTQLRPEQPQTGKVTQGERPNRSVLAQLPFWLLLALTVVCGLKVLALSTNPKVIVMGKTSVSATYLQSSDTYAAAAHKLLASSVTNRSKLTVNLNGTAAQLEREFPELQTVSLGVPLIGSRPIVYVQIAQPSLVLQTSHGNYALNKTGLTLAKLQAIPAGVPLVVDQSAVVPQPGKQSLPSSTVQFSQTLSYQLAAAHLTVSTFVLPQNNPYELDVRLSGQPYTVKCNLQGDALVQSGAAIATVQQLGSTVPSSYVDVRVPDRVYYK